MLAWACEVYYLIAESHIHSLVCFHVAVEELNPAESTTIAVQLIRAGAGDAWEQPNSLNLLWGGFEFGSSKYSYVGAKGDHGGWPPHVDIGKRNECGNDGCHGDRKKKWWM